MKLWIILVILGATFVMVSLFKTCFASKCSSFKFGYGCIEIQRTTGLEATEMKETDLEISPRNGIDIKV